MPREAELSLNEQEFIRQALRENVRLDGRQFNDYRHLDLSFGEEYGVADIRLGKTRVLARISAEVTTPFPDRKFDGVFQISTELSPLASPAFEVGRQTDIETLLSRILEKTIRRSGALDTESLCIIAGAKCFAVRADIHVLDHDGNLVDASCIALVAALLHFRRPDVQVQGEEVTIFSPREREPVKLSMQHQPFCVSFSLITLGQTTTSGQSKGQTQSTAQMSAEDVLLVDSTLSEEKVRDGEIVISMNRFGEVCQIAKYGGASADPIAILNCTTVALDRVKHLHQFVTEKVAQDEQDRDKAAGGLMAELSAENER